MARRPASRGRSSSSRGSSKKRQQKAYEDDDLIIEEDSSGPSPKARGKRSARSSTSSSRGSSKKSGGSKGGGGRRKKGPAPKKQNNDMVVYVGSGVSIFLLIIVMYLFLANSGGVEITDDSRHIKQAKAMLEKAQASERKWHKAEHQENESDRVKYIREARDYAKATLEAINELREIDVYMEDEDSFKPEYQWVEAIEQKAGQLLHDVAKQAHTTDFNDN